MKLDMTPLHSVVKLLLFSKLNYLQSIHSIIPLFRHKGDSLCHILIVLMIDSNTIYYNCLTLGNQEWCIKMILFIYIGTKSKTFAVNHLVQACVSSSAANILYLLFGFRIVSRLLYRCLVTSM